MVDDASVPAAEACARAGIAPLRRCRPAYRLCRTCQRAFWKPARLLRPEQCYTVYLRAREQQRQIPLHASSTWSCPCSSRTEATPERHRCQHSSRVQAAEHSPMPLRALTRTLSENAIAPLLRVHRPVERWSFGHALCSLHRLVAHRLVLRPSQLHSSDVHGMSLARGRSHRLPLWVTKRSCACAEEGGSNDNASCAEYSL